MKILVLGSGWMGSAAAYDVAGFGKEHTLGLADQNREQVEKTASTLNGNVEQHSIDCDDENATAQLFNHYDIVISAAPYRFNAKLTSIAIDTKTHFLDLGGNSDIVREQLEMHMRAKTEGITVIPNCGLAPGLSNILAMTGFNQFESVDSIHARVGGLPQEPRPPLKYQLIFSVEGLLNEYIERAEIIEDGKRRFVPSMTGLESVIFGDQYPEFEAFYTSGGLSLLPQILEGKVKNLSYKTIRYKGHCEKFKTLLDLGFAGSEPVMIGGGIHTTRELFAELLRKKLSAANRDVVLFRVEISGVKNGERRVLRYEMTDRYDTETKMTAMMRTTAYPTTAIGLMLANEIITDRGVYLPEQIIDGEQLIDDLQKRGIKITKTFLSIEAYVDKNLEQ